MKIYFFAQKALSLHCAVAVTAFLLYCKIDFFVRAKNCTANVARDSILKNWFFCVRKKLPRKCCQRFDIVKFIFLCAQKIAPQMLPKIWHMKSPILNLMCLHFFTIARQMLAKKSFIMQYGKIFSTYCHILTASPLVRWEWMIIFGRPTLKVFFYIHFLSSFLEQVSRKYKLGVKMWNIKYMFFCQFSFVILEQKM